MMNGHGKSDSSIVPRKSPNKAAGRAAEGMEGRELAKGNQLEQNALRTQRRGIAYSALERVRQAVERVASYLRQEPYEVVPHVRICAGGAGQPASLPRPEACDEEPEKEDAKSAFGLESNAPFLD